MGGWKPVLSYERAGLGLGVRLVVGVRVGVRVMVGDKG